MGYRATKPTVYIVYWPQIHVVKVGFSCNQRWRPFVLRGARVVDLIEFDTAADAFEFETVVGDAFRQVGQPAFANSQAAKPHLGGSGGGWLECFRLPLGVGPLAVLRGTDWMAA